MPKYIGEEVKDTHTHKFLIATIHLSVARALTVIFTKPAFNWLAQPPKRTHKLNCTLAGLPLNLFLKGYNSYFILPYQLILSYQLIC